MRRLAHLLRLSSFGFTRRIATIFVLVIFVVIALSVATQFLARERLMQRDVALPERIAAIIDLLESGPQRDRARVLKAVQSSDLAVQQTAALPADIKTGSRHPMAEWSLRQQMTNPDRHDVVVVSHTRFAERPLAAWLERNAAASTASLTIAVRLADNSHVVFRTFGSVGRRIFGLPPGFALAVVGAFLALAAVIYVAREARPLRLLRDSVVSFAADARPRPVRQHGAPDIQSLIGAVNAMQSRIAQLVAGRTVLLGAISHDLRTFLTRLRMRVETHPDADTRERAVNDLEAMTELLDRSLLFARLDERGDEPKRVDLRSLLAREVTEYPPEAVTFIDASHTKTTDVSGDALALRRVFNNLIENGLKFGTRVTIELRVDADHIVICVDDDGPGVPEAEHVAIFEPFYRLERSRNRKTGGTGLGLAIARQIVSGLAGTVTVARSPSGGARFIVTLPPARLELATER
ncbi:MAG: ATP-binding protein [Pseudomonadota bacterium]